MVARLDRLAHNLTEGLRTIEELHAQGIHIRALAENLDTGDDSPTSRLMLLSLAEWERETIRDRIRTGVHRAAAEGRTGGRPPALDSRSCGPSGTSWQRRIGQRSRPGVPSEPAHREGGQGTDTSGDSAVRPRRAVPRRGDRGTKPSSSTISRLRRDICRCRLSSGISSRVSSGPLYLVFTGATPRRGYPGGVLRQHGTAGPPGLAGYSPVTAMTGRETTIQQARWQPRPSG